MKHILLITSVFYFLLSCQSSQKEASFSTEESYTTEASSGDGVSSETIEIERKLIKEGRVSFETNSIKTTRELVLEAVVKNKGYVSSDREDKYSEKISQTIVVRVPAKNFDLLLQEATKEVTQFDTKDIEIKDVTEEFLDVEARLKTKKELEKRYLEILTKANTVSEILEVERQIGELRSVIESIEGRLKYMKSKVSFSTLTISFYQEIPKAVIIGNDFGNGFRNGWRILILFFVFLVNVWPFIILGIGLIWGIRKWRKRQNKQII